MDTEIKEDRRITRRRILSLGTGTLALITTACGLDTPTSSDRARPLPKASVTEQPPTPIPEIKGKVPGRYSEFIRTNGLEPQVFLETQDEHFRIRAAISYFERFVEAVEKRPDLWSKPLSVYLINKNNYPIAIPFDAARGDDWTIYHVVNNLLKDHKVGRLVVEPRLNQLGLAGSTSEFTLRDGKWTHTKSTVTIKEDFMKRGLFTEGKQVYHQITDVELALVILHEYAHILQDHLVVEFINRDARTLAEIGTDKGKFVSTIRTFSDRFNSLVVRNAGMQIAEVRINANEAQANAVMSLLLYQLNILNGSQSFPGTRRLDPQPEVVQQIRAGSYPDFINLYQLFTETVVKTNALDQRWLQAARKIDH